MAVPRLSPTQVIKSGLFAESFLRQQLAMAVFDNTFLQHSLCSSHAIMNHTDTGTYHNWATNTWDQCVYNKKTEQCTIECLYRYEPALFNTSRCLWSNQQHDYLTGIIVNNES